MTSIPVHHVYHRTWWALTLRGVLALLIGIYIFVRPISSVAFFALMIALWALVTGIIQIVRAIDLRNAFRAWWVVLLGGIISIVFGVAALFYYPTLSLTLAVIWIAWWLVAGGLTSLYLAVHERGIGMTWGWTAALGVIELIAGVAALVYPVVTLSVALALIGAFACVSGVILLVSASRSYQHGHHIRTA